MKLVSPILKQVVYPALSSMHYLKSDSDAPIVLTYHGVLPAGYIPTDADLDGVMVSANAFRKQLRFLRKKYVLISPEHFRAWMAGEAEMPSRAVLLTCDDGLKNVYEEMVPILQEFEAPCLCFVTGQISAGKRRALWYDALRLMLLAVTGAIKLTIPEVSFCGRANTAEEKSQLRLFLLRTLSSLGAPEREQLLEVIRQQLGLPEEWLEHRMQDKTFCSRFALMDEDEMLQLLQAGICFGAHTMTHPMLSQLPDELAWKEISESRNALEQALGIKVWALAYPFGTQEAVTSREIQMGKDAGYEAAFLNIPGKLDRKSAFSLPRIHVSGEMIMPEFEAHICGFHHRLQEYFKRGIEAAAVL